MREGLLLTLIFFFPSLSHASGRKIRSVLGAFSLNLTAGYSSLPWDLQHWSTQAVPLWIPFSVFFFGLCGVVVICTYESTEKTPKPKQQQQQKTPKNQPKTTNPTPKPNKSKQTNKTTKQKKPQCDYMQTPFWTKFLSSVQNSLWR